MQGKGGGDAFHCDQFQTNLLDGLRPAVKKDKTHQKNPLVVEVAIFLALLIRLCARDRSRGSDEQHSPRRVSSEQLSFLGLKQRHTTRIAIHLAVLSGARFNLTSPPTRANATAAWPPARNFLSATRASTDSAKRRACLRPFGADSPFRLLVVVPEAALRPESA